MGTEPLILKTPAKNTTCVCSFAKYEISQFFQTDQIGIFVALQINLELIDSHADIFSEGQVYLFEQEAVEGGPANKWPHLLIFREHLFQFDLN